MRAVGEFAAPLHYLKKLILLLNQMSKSSQSEKILLQLPRNELW